MKKSTFLIIFVVLFSSLSASIDFSIEEVNRFAFCQNYYSNTTMDIDFPYMYALTSYGLEIYEIQDNGLMQKMSGLPIRGSWKFVRKDNFLYIGTYKQSYISYDQTPLYIYRVDISDKYNPQITKTLEFNNSYEYMIPVLIGDYFIAQAYWGPDAIYTIPDLEYYGTLPDEDMWLKVLNDTISVNWTYDPSVYDLYNTSDITNFQYITTVDMYNIHGGYNPEQFQIINDTICVASGQTAFSFWDISNPAQWEYMSHYEPSETLKNGINFTINENYIVLSQFYGLELVDISDLYNPQSLNYCDFESYNKYYITSDNNYIYIGSWQNGIGIYHIENQEIQFAENYYEYPSFNYSTHLYNDHLFVESYGHGIYIFDVSNPLNPSEVVTCLKDAPLRSPIGHDSRLVMHDFDDYTIKVYDISEPNNPVLRNTIDDLSFMDWLYSVVRFDDSEPQSVYISDYMDGDIRKYDISEPGECPILLTYNITNKETDFIARDGYGYFYTRNTYPQHLYVVNGLHNNNPEIVNTINDFTQIQDPYPYFRLCGEYFCISKSNPLKKTKLYSLENPISPELKYILDYPSINSWPEVYNDLLFTKTSDVSFVYDLNETTSDTLYSIECFNGLFVMYGYDFYDIGDIHYLFVTERSSIGVYEFSYSYSTNPEPEVPEHYFTSCPNPFSNSTTISLSLTTNLHELSRIKIYNVKGQLVRELKIENLKFKMNEVVWDGRDEKGNDVKSGVYFYKLADSDEHIGKVLKLR